MCEINSNCLDCLQCSVIGITSDNLKETEMEIFSKEFSEKPITELISISINDNSNFNYKIINEHGKFYFVTV